MRAEEVRLSFHPLWLLQCPLQALSKLCGTAVLPFNQECSQRAVGPQYLGGPTVYGGLDAVLLSVL